MSKIKLSGEWYQVEAARECNGAIEIETDGGEFILFPTREDAGEAAAERWREMAEHDPEEFRCMVGDECLVKWALGQMAGPGNVQVSSLEEWFDLVAEHPEEEFGSYDGQELEVEGISSGAMNILDEFRPARSPDDDDSRNALPGVAYRTN